MKKLLPLLALLTAVSCYKPKDWDPADARDHVPPSEPVTIEYAVATPAGPGLQYMVMNVEDSRSLTNWIDDRAEAERFQAEWRRKYPGFGSYIVWRQKP